MGGVESPMTGEGMAAVIGSIATLVGVLGNVVLQLKQLKMSKSNSDKLDDVHQATANIAEATGTHKVLPPE